MLIVDTNIIRNIPHQQIGVSAYSWKVPDSIIMNTF